MTNYKDNLGEELHIGDKVIYSYGTNLFHGKVTRFTPKKVVINGYKLAYPENVVKVDWKDDKE